MRIVCIFVVAVALAQSARAQHQDLIHSDLPLWVEQREAMWPKHLEDEIGCAHRLKLGDWSFGQTVDESGTTYWYRFGNYGVFHCNLMVWDANELAELGLGRADYSFMIDLGKAPGLDGPMELWALQRGTRPGSDYMLLARRPTPGIIERFDVLQQRCPRGNIRKTLSLDTLLTEYCAINSKRELRALARQMARLPPLGVVSFARQTPEETTE